MPYDLTAAKKAIFAECRQQGIDEVARRAMIREVGGVASGSSKDMGADAARRVLNHLRQKSAPAGRQEGEWIWVNNAPVEKRDLLWKIRRCCIEIGIADGQQGGYAEGVAARISGVPRKLRMMSSAELYAVAGALSRTQKSRESRAK